MFKPVDPRVSFPKMEQEVLSFWQRNAIFRRSIEERPEDRLFIFYEGPPTANARPGIHHVLSRVFKDLIPRYKTMRGYRVPRKGGWDTHGLPVELEVEKELGLKSKPEIEDYGIAAFNAKCKDSVSRYVEEWTRLSERIAFWADYDNPYVTYSNDYIETCWWIFKQMWDHGLVYQDYRVTPHCPRCGTSLSDHEVSLGYQDDTPDPSVFVKFRVHQDEWTKKGQPQIARRPGEYISLVAWTTTPWTLPGNTALAVNPEADYGVYELADGEQVVVAVDLAEAVLGLAAKARVVLKGSRLAGLAYEPLYRPELHTGTFRRFGAGGRIESKAYLALDGGTGATLSAIHEETDRRRVVLAADYVSLEDGSGIVHVAPAFGAEDFKEGRLHGLLFSQPIDLSGTMDSSVNLETGVQLPGAGKFAKRADRDVERDLEERGLMLKKATIKHTYPFCWRCGTPLLYYAKPSWYIRTTRQKEALLQGNGRINWYPEHIKTGRFGNWLENNIDWAVSRERYWGTPLPFWKCDDCATPMCCGSKAEIVEHAIDPDKAEALDDFHRPFIDDILLRCEKCGGAARRVPEVADAWFDSGAMPYAQWHYPFENEDEFLKHFPADFICEAIDQTRGWFYTLHAEATMLKATESVPDGISYRNVICLGHINDEKGNKMSKSRGNTVEPWSVLDAHGADATRWYMYAASPAGSSRRFSSGLVEEGLRRFLLTLWNTYSFFVSYANIDGYKPTPGGPKPAADIDRWLLSELNALVLKVTEELEAYDPTDAARAIEAFVDDLSNWYVRRSRRRFWRGATEGDADKQSAYDTLYTALTIVTKLIAPFTPFIAEELWQNLVRSTDESAPISVHLATWPEADESLIDESLNAETQLVKRVCSLGRAARAKAQIKVRQPVAQVLVKPRTAEEALSLRKNANLVLEELNAKALDLLDDETAVVTYDVKPNLPVLGKKYGAEVAAIRAGLAAIAPAEVAEAVRRGRNVSVAGKDLEPEDILLQAQDTAGYAAAQEAGYTVAVSTAISPELADEGLARELVRRIQDMRRDAGFDLAARITTWVLGDGDVARVLASQGDYIRAETLSTELLATEPAPGAHSAGHDLEGTKVTIAVRKS